MLGHQRPVLPGIPEHRWRLARTAFRGEGGGPPGHGHGHHGATEILHKQSRCLMRVPSSLTFREDPAWAHRDHFAFLGFFLAYQAGPYRPLWSARPQWVSLPREHGHAEADIPQPVEAGNQPESGHPRQTAASRMARGLPAEGPPRLRRDCPVARRGRFCLLSLANGA